MQTGQAGPRLLIPRPRDRIGTGRAMAGRGRFHVVHGIRDTDAHQATAVVTVPGGCQPVIAVPWGRGGHRDRLGRVSALAVASGTLRVRAAMRGDIPDPSAAGSAAFLPDAKPMVAGATPIVRAGSGTRRRASSVTVSSRRRTLASSSAPR